MTLRDATRVRPHANTAWDGDPGPVRTFGGRPVEPGPLARALAEALEGEVRFDCGARGAYAQDASHYRQVPIGVVVPRHADDVRAAVRICREHGAPLLGRGGGTSLAGQCCNVAVVLDFTKYMNRVLEVDAEERVARVEPGCVLDDLRAAAAPHGLTFGPDPATHSHCTLGGMVMNDSCGVHSVLAQLYGPGPRTEHQLVSLRVLTYDGLELEVGPTPPEELDRIVAEGGRKGELYGALRDLRDAHADAIRARFPAIPRRVSGYNLPALLPESDFDLARALCGTEGTCAIVLEAEVRLIWRPRHDVLVVLGYDDVAQAADRVPDVMAHRPVALEGLDSALLRDMRHEHFHAEDLRYLPGGDAFLLVELGADDADEAGRLAERLLDDVRSSAHPPREARIYTDEERRQRVWEVRESGLGATAWVPGEPPTWPGWEDAAVPPEVVGDYLRDFRDLLDRHGLKGDLYGHFGQGCVHTRIDFDLRTRAGLERYERFVGEAADLVVRYGGSLSGEHGDGQSRAALLGKMYGERLVEAFRAFKRAWDPEWRLNPGKVVDAYGPTENLQLGQDYGPAPQRTHFHFPVEHGGFAGVTERCVGVGRCRRGDGGVMCPSYMVTREELHSTRGRARLLFEMMRGDVVRDGWRSKAVEESLDLCLSCKGCKSDCPVDVDMATYKAEFFAHRYRRRLRPRQAYAFGGIHWWSRLAGLAPRTVNAAARQPWLAALAKRAAGVAPSRDLPPFAEETLRAWFHRRHRPKVGGRADEAGRGAAARPSPGSRGRVLLWPDTFTNAFHPGTGRSAVALLEEAGYQVVLPRKVLCCGRPLFEYGFLGTARRLLRQVVDELRAEIRAGTPLVGLEPSCVAAFRDELVGLLPTDPDARRLQRQAFVLAEFVAQNREHFPLPRVGRRALVHAHCHHHAVLDWSAEAGVLDAVGLDWERPEEGCCGMAGAFGFTDGARHEVSVALGERRLAPAVRAADPDTLVIADGFSCREQVRQLTGRLPLHLAEVLRPRGRGRGGRREEPAE